MSVPSSFGHYYPICSGNTATLTVNLTQGTFDWSNGATGTQTNVSNTGFYTIKNTQPNGCTAYSLPIEIEVITIDNTVSQSENKLIANMAGAS